MPTPTSHWKLGLFVLLGAVMTLTMLGVLGVRSMHKETGRYVSYFDESVQGLEVGSPIKFRGVTIGTVGGIDVAPDHRHVEVVSELHDVALSRLGLDVATGLVRRGAPKKLVQANDLRVQLASAGLTGIKFLQLDFFPVAAHPRPVLPFAVPKNYIPAASSMMKNLESSLMRTMNSLPKITEEVLKILGRVDGLVGLGDSKLFETAVATIADARALIGEIHRKVAKLQPARLMAQLQQTLAGFGGLVTEVRQKVATVDPARLSAQLEQALAGFNGTAARVNKILARVDGRQGLLSSALRASNAFGDTARTAGGLGNQVEDTLRAVSEAAKSFSLLAAALEKEPDMLVKGREKQQ